MSLIKDLKNVKDEEITLLDVKRAEEIIARANNLLGRPTVKEIHHWNGWAYWPSYTFSPSVTWTNAPTNLCATSGTTQTFTSRGLDTSLTQAVAQILS